MKSLPPWADGPFELLLHAEEHYLNGEDFDRRIALISYDNVIEVSITTYLSLKPIQRGNRNYKKDNVSAWLNNYYTRLDFLECELRSRGIKWEVEKSYILWIHDQRNEQYHGGIESVPGTKTLDLARNAALWIFSLLFEISNSEELLKEAILLSQPSQPLQRDDESDCLIDNEFEMVEIMGQNYYMSEVLFAVDPIAYREISDRLRDQAEGIDLGGQEVKGDLL